MTKEDRAKTRWQAMLVGLTLFAAMAISPALPAGSQEMPRLEERAREILQRNNPALAEALRKRPRPGLTFRAWANKPKPFAASFLFCAFISIIGTGFFPGFINSARAATRKKFWRCLGVSVMVLITGLMLSTILYLIEIGIPLAHLIAACLQLILLAGLCVAVSTMGHAILARAGLSSSDWAARHPRLFNLLVVFTGSILFALMVQIPGFGKVPPVGIRIAVLLALVGAGGLLRATLLKPKGEEEGA
ncbi:MAG: hypothetical protein IPM23_09180 [Candidatus Melainabacteria bacterium]|nr:hypothetical protein [Candidatus Melainabacteria bacterium]